MIPTGIKRRSSFRSVAFKVENFNGSTSDRAQGDVESLRQLSVAFGAADIDENYDRQKTCRMVRLHAGPCGAHMYQLLDLLGASSFFITSSMFFFRLRESAP